MIDDCGQTHDPLAEVEEMFTSLHRVKVEINTPQLRVQHSKSSLLSVRFSKIAKLIINILQEVTPEIVTVYEHT